MAQHLGAPPSSTGAGAVSSSRSSSASVCSSSTSACALAAAEDVSPGLREVQSARRVWAERVATHAAKRCLRARLLQVCVSVCVCVCLRLSVSVCLCLSVWHVLMHPPAQVLDVWKDAACEMSLQVHSRAPLLSAVTQS